MLTHIIKILSLTIFIVLSRNVSAQQNIPISDSLAAHAEVLELTKGYISGKKIKKYHFSDYSMHTYKRITANTREKENFSGTKTTTTALYKSSFRLSNSLQDTAQVLMSQQSENRTEKNLVLGIVHFGDSETLNSSYFTAWITINGDTANTWTLFVGTSSGPEADNMHTAYLSNGARKIDLILVQALEKATNNFGLPAMGYEFIEEGKSLGAIQMFNGNLFATSYTVWIDNRLDTKNKLLLATAMTAIVYEPDEFNH